MPRVAHARADHRLKIEGQPVLRPPRHVVQVKAQRPQEVPRPPHVAVLIGGHDHAARRRRRADQLGKTGVGIDVAVDPVQRLQVAQTAAALLHIRFHHERRVAIAPVPRVALGLLGGNELANPRLGTGAAEGEPEFLEHQHIAGNMPRVEQRRPHRDVAARLAQAILDRARGVPHLQPEIPQDIEHELHRRLRVLGRIPRRQKQQVDIAERRQHPAPIAASPRQAEPPNLATRLAVGCHRQRMLMQCHHQRVGQPGQRAGGLKPLDAALLEAVAHQHLHAPQMPAQHRQRRVPFQRRAIGTAQRRAQLGQRAIRKLGKVRGFKHRADVNPCHHGRNCSGGRNRRDAGKHVLF